MIKKNTKKSEDGNNRISEFINNITLQDEQGNNNDFLDRSILDLEIESLKVK